MKGWSLLAFTSLGVKAAFGAVFFQSTDDLSQEAEYDFIVAGGGIGGGVVAARLAENPNWKVLIIEAGPSNEDVFATHVPGLEGQLIGTHVDWNYTITPSSNGIPAHYARGRMLGGSSSHNGMVFTRGSRDDWDQWAEIVENEALGWDNIMPFLLKAENLVEDSENHTEEGHVNPAIHGHDGNLFVSPSFGVHPMNDMMLQVTKEAPREFPFLLDMNAGKPIGISWNLFTIDHKAERSSSATAYVETSGENLHVLLNTYVMRVLPAGDGTDFRGVEFATDAQSERRQLFAKKEVIVAGGVIGSPQILLNSGIGDREELEAVGVETLVHNPSVGKNFTDQPFMLALFNTTIQNTDFDADAALAEWNATRTGPLTLAGHISNQVVWVRLPDDSSLFSQDGFTNPSPGPNSPHIEIYLSQISTSLPDSNGAVPLPPEFENLKTIQLQIVNLHPVSRGSIILNSSDPFAHPIFDANLLSEDVDTSILREGIRSTRRLFSAPVFMDNVTGSVYPASNVTTDEDIDAFVISAVGPYLHGTSTAGMSPKGASWGVVDPDYRVKGTTGLRVVDASVIPNSPSGHSQAPVYGFAERAGVVIAEAWKRKSV